MREQSGTLATHSISLTFRLLILFAVAFSLATAPSTLSSNFHFPSLTLAHAVADTNRVWLPAGPASDHMTTPIYTDQVAEFNNLQQGTPPGSGSSIDLTDQQLTPGLVSPLTSSTQFLVTPTIREHGYFEIEMDLSNTFWNCNFLFGNSTCGVNIRQGIAHLIDKQTFVANDANILSTAVALDNPVPLDNGGLTTPNSCNWDSLYAETTSCFVGSSDATSPFYTGGNAYRLAKAPSSSTGAQSNPSLDFCAAAGHFIAAGVATNVVSPPAVATGPVWWQHQPSDWTITSSTNCVLLNPVAGTTPTFFIRQDDVRRLDLGNLLAGQICLLFTGSSTTPCANLTPQIGLITTFSGFLTSPIATTNNWWFYTAAFISVYPYDSTLYFLYNSRFVSGFKSIQGTTAGHSCSPQSTGSFSAGNYMYLCDVNYDSISSEMEFAPCPGGAPPAGTPTPTFTTCNGALSALSSGYKAEDRFGRGAYTIPIMNSIDQYAYLNNGWQRIVNSGNGIANYFTWLNAWNSASTTIRQGFKQTSRSLSPYIASTAWDFYILGNIADTLGTSNPYDNSQLFNYMTVSTNLLCNTSSQCTSALTYAPPAGTVATYRYTLRSDIFFHDGKQLTSFDVVFNYLSLLASGAFQSSGASPIIAITVLSPTQFDFNINGNGPTTALFLASLTILSSAYWTSAGQSAWNSAAASCSIGTACFPAQYAINFGLIGSNGLPSIVCNSGTGLTGCLFPASYMNVNGAQATATYDPVFDGTLIGSGPWMCVSSIGTRGQGCAPGARENPDAGTSGYTLTRFGFGENPGASLTDSYFRSSGTVALWFWSGNTGSFTHDFLNFGVVARCVGLPLGTVGCTQWQQGIGGDLNGTSQIVQPIPQASIVARFVGIDMVSEAANLNRAANPAAPWTPTAVAMLAVGTANSFDGFPAPILYEGSATLNPASVTPCTSAYPVGGYDC